MNIIRPHKEFDAWYIDDFIPSTGLVRSAAESFDRIAPEWWVSYGDEGQIGKCSPASINSITHECLLIMDYISTHFDTTMLNKNDKTFPGVAETSNVGVYITNGLFQFIEPEDST